MTTPRDSAIRLPKAGLEIDEVKRMLLDARAEDVDWRSGRSFRGVFHATDEVEAVARQAYDIYFAENALITRAFPSLKRLDAEVVAMSAGLLNAPEVAGSTTSGGSESILIAMKTTRDWARVRRPDIATPEIVLPVTAHPAFDKAAGYFGLRTVRTPVTKEYRADVDAMRRAITRSTIAVVGSAPTWPHGRIDPIADIAQLAQEHDLACHVDACVGGFFLPFMRRLGYDVPVFDFRLPGVTSMSADLHKYGYAPKGISVVLYRSADIHRHQAFVYQWPGGEYVAPTMTGTRPGGAVAGAWAVMRFLGEDGYTALVDRTMKTTEAFLDGIDKIPGLEAIRPDMSLFAYGSSTLDIYAVADGMGDMGWFVSRQVVPPSIHVRVDPIHAPIVERYVSDLAIVTQRVVSGEIKSRGTAITYA